MDEQVPPPSPDDHPDGWPVHPGDVPPVREGGWQPDPGHASSWGQDPTWASSWTPPHEPTPPGADPRGPVPAAGLPPVPPPAPPPGPPPAPPAPGAGPPRHAGFDPRRSGRSRALVGFVAGLLLALMVGGVGFALGRQQDGTGAASPASTPAPQRVSITPAAPGTVEPAEAVAKALGPAVVQIETDQGLGSGFIYDTDGHILTASHVTNGASSVQVRLADGTTEAGQVLGEDAGTDVAVVKIRGSADLPVAKLALGKQVEVGQTAIAIGSPFGLDQTVTAGIVSATGRSMNTPGGAIPMIQTDAPINPGNSGGALADRNGEVIGINDSIESQSGSNAGVGFAIPIDTAKSVADKLIKGEKIQTAVLGVSGTDSQTGQSGAVITQVVSGSPAAKANLQEGDVITALDGQSVTGMVDLAAKIRSHQPGDEVTLTVTRGNRTSKVTVTLAKSSR